MCTWRSSRIESWIGRSVTRTWMIGWICSYFGYIVDIRTTAIAASSSSLSISRGQSATQIARMGTA